ncbi:MAG: MerR family transcriptional regulator [Propionibacteriaceae bacterium]
MKMAELSATSGFPVATIKYYLREGLLPAGATTGRNQADYGEEHVSRLRLIRVLQSVGGMSVAKVRELLAAVDTPELPLLEVLGTMQENLALPTSSLDNETGLTAAARQIDTMIDSRGWGSWAGDPNRTEAARLLATWSGLSPSIADSTLSDLLNAYAEAAEIVAERDLDLVRQHAERDAMVDIAVVGTVVGDALFAVLRRLAQVHVSQKHFPPATLPDPGTTRQGSR